MKASLVSLLGLRIMAMVPVVIVVLVAAFVLLHLTPGDPAAVIGGETATPADLERIRQGLGLDQPLHVQFGRWALSVLQGDLGNSVISAEPVTKLLAQRMVPTITLAASTVFVSMLLGVPLGAFAAWNAGRWLDSALTGFAVLAFSLPVFLVGYLLVDLLSLQWKLLPVQGFRSFGEGIVQWLRHLVLPTFCLSLVFVALIARMTRASVIEIAGSDFIRTARAKGVPEGRILAVHALRNASVPIATTIGLGIAQLLGGVIIVENVFAIPGIGRLVVDAVLSRDFPVIRGVILVMSFTYLFINLAVDLLYLVLDPRIRR